MASAVGNSIRTVRSRTVTPCSSGSSRRRARSSSPHSAGRRSRAGARRLFEAARQSARRPRGERDRAPGPADADEFLGGPQRPRRLREPEGGDDGVEAVVGVRDVFEIEQVAAHRARGRDQARGVQDPVAGAELFGERRGDGRERGRSGARSTPANSPRTRCVHPA